jgi:hypothetical protein
MRYQRALIVQRRHQSNLRNTFRKILRACGNFATNCGSRCDQIGEYGHAGMQWTVPGGLVMRTVISDAPSPRRLHWQAALTYSPYQSLSPVIWQHRFVSEMPMTSWSCGAKLRLTEFGANTARGRRRRAVSKTITYSRCASSSSV